MRQFLLGKVPGWSYFPFEISPLRGTIGYSERAGVGV